MKIRIKARPRLNKRLSAIFFTTGNFLAIIAFIGINDIYILFNFLKSANSLILFFKSALILAPIFQLYAVILSGYRRIFGGYMVAVVFFGLVLALVQGTLFLLGIDYSLWADFVVNGWLLRYQKEHILLCAVCLFYLSLLEFRFGKRWYSLFYNQSDRDFVMGIFTILGETQEEAAEACILAMVYSSYPEDEDNISS